MPKIGSNVPSTKELGIYIPTLGRIGIEKHITLTSFLNRSKYRPYLVCPPEEVDLHKKYYERVIGCPAKDIGSTRQWIMENCESNILYMVDDDMKFFVRPDMQLPKLYTAENMNELLDATNKIIYDGYMYGGLSARQGNNHVMEAYRDVTRCYNFHVLDRNRVLATKIRWDSTPIMEDFVFTLNLLTRGIANRVLYQYCWDQRSGSKAGCNVYRTVSLQGEMANKVHLMFPKFATVVKKVSKSGHSIAQGDRLDLRIAWRKAYEFGLERKAIAANAIQGRSV